jgi:diguanylate cyclase (GGDEF)-like protein
MKIGKAQGTGRAARSSGVLTRTRGDNVAEISRAPAKIAALGIPDSELTPRVREALHALIGDVDRLTQETHSLRARLDDASRNADQDALLPILNRRAFTREVARFISFADRYGTPAVLLYFDLNNFKAVNDVHGHAAGDSVLRHFADVMTSQIRESDVLARLGGDEFGAILAHVTVEQAYKKGERLAQALRDHPPVWNGLPVELDFAIGTYELKAGEAAEAAIAKADRAMYEHKREGR